MISHDGGATGREAMKKGGNNLLEVAMGGLEAAPVDAHGSHEYNGTIGNKDGMFR